MLFVISCFYYALDKLLIFIFIIIIVIIVIDTIILIPTYLRK